MNYAQLTVGTIGKPVREIWAASTSPGLLLFMPPAFALSLQEDPNLKSVCFGIVTLFPTLKDPFSPKGYVSVD